MIPLLLRQAIQKRKCVLYAGAGFSREAIRPDGVNMPTGSELAYRLADELFRGGHYHQAPTEDQIFSLMELAEDFEEAFGRLHMIELLLEIFDPVGLAPGEAHKLAVKYFPTIITTNYDRLFETAVLQERSQGPIVVRRENQSSMIAASDRTTIIKLHGDLDDVNRIVITNEDYLREPIPTGLQRELEGYISKTIILFVGSSLADSDFQELYLQVFDRLGKMMPSHFMVTPFPAENSSGRKKWELYRKRRSRRKVEFIDGTAGSFFRQLESELAVNTGEDNDA
jgi:hypothetical protein